MPSTTPPSINEDVRRLCEKIGTGTEPIYVPVQETSGNPFNECFVNVQRKTSSKGGQSQLGWTIWENPGQLIEAEFHAIWVRPDGVCVDVTPKQDGEKQILFLPDHTRKYNKEPVNNVRLALSDDPKVKRLIEVNENLFKLRLRHNNDGRSIIPAGDIVDLLGIGAAPRTLSSRVAKVGRNELCPCGSGKKYKRCHGS